MRRNRLARSMRSIIEQLEGRVLLSSALPHAIQPADTVVVDPINGNATITGTVQYDPAFNSAGGGVIAGATVFLDLNHDNTPDPGDPTVATDASGSFTFQDVDSVPLGTTYWVEVAPQTGYHLDPPGYQAETVMAGVTANATLLESNEAGISGIFYEDNNQDGIYEPAIDTPEVGGTVYIDANKNGILDAGETSTTTNGQGFFNLPAAPGTYEIRCVPDPGFVQDPPQYVTVTVGASDQAVANVGEGEGATITGVVKYDPNSGGGSIMNATVFVDLNHDHTLDAGDPNAITDANGDFTLTPLYAEPTGTTFWVEVIPQAGYHQDAPGYQGVTLTTGASNAQNVVILESDETGISGILYADNNQNGVYDPGIDVPLAGDTVYIDANDSGVLTAGDTTAVTDSNGMFNLPAAPGTYEVRVVPRPNFSQDAPGYVTATVGSSDQTVANVGETNGSSINGIVFIDASGSGAFAAGDTPVAGELVEINAIGTNTSGYSDEVTTAADGSYSFPGLTPGQYRLMIDTVDGTSGNLEDNPGYIDVTLTAGQQLVQNIGEGVAASVSGVAFDDNNGNGVQDPGELGLSNQTVYIDINNNGADDTAGVGSDGLPLAGPEPTGVTEADGQFDIGNLGPGTYTVRLQTPQGVLITDPTSGANSYTFTVGSGQNATGKVFGFQTPDLAIAMVQSSTAPVLDGAKQKAAFRVTNVGSLPAIGQVSVDLYASTVQAFDIASATLSGATTPINVDLQPGQSKIVKLKYSYPTTLASGSYYITGQIVTTVSDNNRANNSSQSIGPVQITQPYIDLNLAYETQPSAVVFPGAATVLNLILTNNGNVTNSTTLMFHIYLSPTNTFSSGETIVRSVPVSGLHLKAGASKVIHLTLVFPGETLGVEYPIVTVDSGNPLGEANLTNNVAIPLAPTTFE